VDLTPNINRHFKVCSHVITGAPVGEHIAVRKPNNNCWHHGVYIGEVVDKEGFYVIDFNGETNGDAIFDLCEVDCFCEGAEQIVSVGYDFAFPYNFSAAVAVEVYKAKRGTCYNCNRNNCEHFTTICRTGRYDVHARITELMDLNICKRETTTKLFK
jgi:hypothetical protein